MPIRHAEKAGQWYSADAVSLGRELDQYLTAVDTSSAVPLLGGLVPHAGLSFSGPIAAHTYAWIRAGVPDLETLLLFGAVHTMALSHPAIWTDGSWESPFGPVEVDRDLAQSLVASGVGESLEQPHYGDNALELQIPFIAHLFPDVKIVPVAVPPRPSAVQAGRQAWTVVQSSGRKVVALGSTDLTHYGDPYGFSPAGTGPEALDWGRQNDQRLLDRITALDTEAIIPTAARDHSACGAGAIAATTAFCQEGGSPEGRVLRYGTSHDMHPDPGPAMFVGYAALVFPEGPA